MNQESFKVGNEFKGGRIVSLHKNFFMVEHAAGYCECYDYPLTLNTHEPDNRIPTMDKAIWSILEEETLRELFYLGKTITQLTKIFDIPSSAIRSKLYRMGLTNNIEINNKNLLGGTYV